MINIFHDTELMYLWYMCSFTNSRIATSSLGVKYWNSISKRNLNLVVNPLSPSILVQILKTAFHTIIIK